MNTTTVAAAHRGMSLLKAVVAWVAGLASAAALAQPLEIIVPFGPGGGADSLARHCAPALQSALGAPVQVRNITGATGNEGIARLLAAPSDGRTVAVLTADTYATLAYANPRWKASDVVPLAIMMKQPSMLFVASSSRFAKWQDFEKEARARPRELRVAISGLGSPDYIALQQLAAKGIQLTPVPRTSPADRFQAVAKGEADAIYEQLGDLRSFFDAGQIRPILAFGDAREAAGIAGVASSKELGLGEGVPQFRAFVVKAGTDPQAVSALAAALERIGASPEYKAFLANQLAAADSFVGASGARALMDRELTQMKQVVRALPMHSQYLFDELKDPGELPAQF